MPYPYYFLHAGLWLCALKVKKMETRSDGNTICLALSYRLFDLDWKKCLILHNVDGNLRVVETAREEWDHGKLDEENREVQMFLEDVSRHRLDEVNTYRPAMHNGIAQWMLDAERAFQNKK